MPGPRVVVVGAGLGGSTLVRELRRHGHTGPVTLVGEEHLPPYDRPPLSKQALRGEHTGPDLLEALPDDVELLLGRRAVGVADGEVLLEDAPPLAYDVLVLAPGAVPRPLPGVEVPPAGVHALRTWDDAVALRADVLTHGELVVVGGGFVGCEVAASARHLGATVTLVELLDTPMARILGPGTAARMIDLHTRHRVELRCGVGVAEVRGDPRVEELVLSDGSRLPTRVVALGLGVTPATGWLRGALALGPDGSVACDGQGRTSRDGVWALGDAASWDGRRVEHWTSAVEQASTVAQALLGAPVAHTAVPYFWSDQHGSTLQGLGELAADTEAEVHEVGDGLVALHARGDRLLGVVCLDAKKHAGRARKLLAAGSGLAAARDVLLR